MRGRFSDHHADVIVRTPDGELHKVNGPALVMRDGRWDWYLFDVWHRYYGPQDNDNEWWIHGGWIKND